MAIRVRLWTSALWAFLGVASVVRGATPAPPTFLGVQQSIAEIRQSWSGPGVQPPETAGAWNALFDALLNDLRSATKAGNDSDRFEALNRIEQTAGSLGTAAWPPATKVQEAVEEWLRPRMRLARAVRTFTESIAALPETNDARLKANRARWIDFALNDLGGAVRAYDASDAVLDRLAALARIHGALDSLKERTRNQPWPLASELQAPLDDMFSQPNLKIVADVPSVAPFFERNLVVTGPVVRKGYTSQVTAGAKTGFGLLQSDDGIAFFNSQEYVSVTPIWDFQNQIASDPRGRLVARLYQFSATTYDWAELTITTVLKSTGLDITPSYRHCIDAAISSEPACEGHLGRTVGALVGFNQQAINNRVYSGSIGQFRERIPAEALEEGQERIAVQRERRNAELRARYLPGNDTVALRDFRLTRLTLSSRPDAALVAGLLGGQNAPAQRGADIPQPARLQVNEPGVVADIHLGSLLSNLTAGAFQLDEVQKVRNVMIVTKEIPAGAPLRDAYTLTRNVDFPTFLKAVEESKKARKLAVVALRITRPQQPPEFAIDARGYLVAVIHDLQIEVPAPPQEARGGPMGAPAQVYRIKIPLTEIVLSYQIDAPSGTSLRVRGKVEDFLPGPNAEVWAIDRDETKAVLLSRFSAAVSIAAMVTRIRNQPIEVTLDQSRLGGYLVRSVSPLDNSGWQRVILYRDPNAPPPDVD